MIRKRTILTLLLSLTALIAGAFALASCGKIDKGSTERIKYDFRDDGTCGVVGIIGHIEDFTDVVISSTYNDVPVTFIGNDAFSRNNCLTSITIPDSVTHIGVGAFMDCTSLTRVSI